MPESGLKFQPRRELGRTGFIATAIGIGDLADRNLPFETCVETARRAIDAGLNLIDTAPMYEDGYSEQIVGETVRGVRDRMFIINKIDELEKPVGPQIDASLSRMGLDHTDAFVFHALNSIEIFHKLLEAVSTSSTNASERERPGFAGSRRTIPTCSMPRSMPTFATSSCFRSGPLSISGMSWRFCRWRGAAEQEQFVSRRSGPESCSATRPAITSRSSCVRAGSSHREGLMIRPRCSRA